MLEALSDQDRPIYATAFYAGLRAGELQALRWFDVDLAAGVIGVEPSWDKIEGEQEPKTRSSRRAVPLTPRLRDELAEHRMRQGRDGAAWAVVLLSGVGFPIGQGETRWTVHLDRPAAERLANQPASLPKRTHRNMFIVSPVTASTNVLKLSS